MWWLRAKDDYVKLFQQTTIQSASLMSDPCAIIPSFHHSVQASIKALNQYFFLFCTMALFLYYDLPSRLLTHVYNMETNLSPASNLPFIDNLKKPVGASKWDGLVLATLCYWKQNIRGSIGQDNKATERLQMGHTYYISPLELLSLSHHHLKW